MEHLWYNVKEMLGLHDTDAQFESTNCIGNLMTEQESMLMLAIETDNVRNTKKHVDDSLVSKIMNLDQKYITFTCNCVQY
jgi:hypothetical protein